MATDDLNARSRSDGERRRARVDGPPLSAVSVVPAAPTPLESTGGSGALDARVAGDAWFDPRGFFLGWLAMVAGYVVFGGTLGASLAGLVVAYLTSRRGRLLNAVVSVAGGYGVALILGVALVALVFIISR
ncbi:MAG: hypothetical protein H0U69_09025 [Trueperaceae bacterium]|nr:hypothetical protein [Trueperaceae bacterium]